MKNSYYQKETNIFLWPYNEKSGLKEHHDEWKDQRQKLQRQVKRNDTGCSKIELWCNTINRTSEAEISRETRLCFHCQLLWLSMVLATFASETAISHSSQGVCSHFKIHYDTTGQAQYNISQVWKRNTNNRRLSHTVTLKITTTKISTFSTQTETYLFLLKCF